MTFRKSHPMTAERAEGIALQGLTFLVSDAARLQRFLALTGTAPDDLRGWAGAPHLQAALLEHLLSDESLLMTFSAEAGLAPEDVAPAAAVLAKG